MAKEDLLFTRREFLHTASLLSVAGASVPGFLANTVAAANAKDLTSIPGFKDDRILVVVQMSGGNDGLNTVVPFSDDNYYKNRPTIGLKNNDLIRLDDRIALNSRLKPLMQFAEQGKLAIVEGVGYPNPNRSHFRSMEIWQTATDSNRHSDTGWIGRYLDNNCSGEAEPVSGVALGNERPQAFGGKKNFGVAFQDPNSFGWKDGQAAAVESNFRKLNQGPEEHNDTLDFLRKVTNNAVLSSDRVREVSKKYRGGVSYPGDAFGNSLQTVAKMIAGNLPTRIYYVTLSGFDTHANQVNTQNNLLGRFANGLAAFQKDLERQGNSERVVILTFSEFGRRVGENASGGTDHGTAAPMFIIGEGLNSGMAGKRPSLTDLDAGDLKFTTDFRSVYGSLMEQWFGASSEPVLGHKFNQINLIKKNFVA